MDGLSRSMSTHHDIDVTIKALQGLLVVTVMLLAISQGAKDRVGMLRFSKDHCMLLGASKDTDLHKLIIRMTSSGNTVSVILVAYLYDRRGMNVSNAFPVI